jgi:hypothetical protein
MTTNDNLFTRKYEKRKTIVKQAEMALTVFWCATALLQPTRKRMELQLKPLSSHVGEFESCEFQW